jgi:poly(ADP-ribose) glycohydrolase ARH3
MAKGDLQGRFRGALLEAAIGDALGAPFEGAPTVPLADLKKLLERPGLLQYTDDTHMTLGVAESLVACGGFNGPHMAETFACNFEAEPWRGYGAGPPQVFRLLREGFEWDQAGRALFNGDGSFGNGAAMRVAPAALAYYYDTEEVVRVAQQSALITHAHELGMEGAVLQALAVAFLVQRIASGAIDSSAFIDFLLTRISSPPLVHRLMYIKTMQPGESRDEDVQALGNGIAAYEAVPAAICAFLHHPNSFPQAVTYAISLGGDTDTIASMTGALSGARLGTSAIPQGWREGIEGSARLVELADALLALVATPRS